MLQLVVLLEQVHSEALVDVSVATRLAGAMCVFMIGVCVCVCVCVCVFQHVGMYTADSSLFLDKDVYQYLSVLLKLYCQPLIQEQLVLPTTSVMGSPSFHDL